MYTLDISLAKLKEEVKIKVLKLTSIAANQYHSRLTYVQLCMVYAHIYTGLIP